MAQPAVSADMMDDFIIKFVDDVGSDHCPTNYHHKITDIMSKIILQLQEFRLKCKTQETDVGLEFIH